VALRTESEANAHARGESAWSSTAVVTLAGVAALGCWALFLNTWVQRDWLESVWLGKLPAALEAQALFAALASVASVATLLAARRGRARAVLAPAVRWAPVLAVLAWTWVWQLPIPRQSFDVLYVLGGAASAWSVLLALGAWRSTWPRKLALVERGLLVVAASVIATELGLRAARSVWRPQLLATAGDDVETWIAAYRRPPGIQHAAYPSDSAGFPERVSTEVGPSKPWVACVGDSFSVGVVPHHLHYTTLAERDLGVEIYNFGVAGAGPREYHHILTRHALPRAPRLVVIALFVGNDLEDAERAPKGWVGRWADAEEVLVRVAPLRAWRLATTGDFERNALESAVHSGAALTVADIERQLPWLADPHLEPPTMSPERFRHVEVNRARWLDADTAVRAASLFEWLERIRAAAAPTPVACVLIPDEFQVEDAVWSDVLAEGLPAHLDRDAPQRYLGAQLAARGFEYVDLLPALRAVPPLEDGARRLYHLRDTHFNARGNAVAARGLVELVRRFELE
jgi:hypothetical protein